MTHEDICDSWEDFADSGDDIDKHVEQGLKMTNGTHSNNRDKKKKSKDLNKTEKLSTHKGKNNASPKPAIRILQRPVVHDEDQNRTPYMPQLKILKRPEKSSEEQRHAEERKRLQAQQPVRTLAQREAAYAEARQRIMGEESRKSSEAAGKATNEDLRPENLKRYSKQSKSHQNGYTNEAKRQPKAPGSGKGFKHNR